METEEFMLAVRFGQGATAKLLRQCVQEYADEIAALNLENSQRTFRAPLSWDKWQGPVVPPHLAKRAVDLAKLLRAARKVRPQQNLNLFRLADYLAKRD